VGRLHQAPQGKSARTPLYIVLKREKLNAFGFNLKDRGRRRSIEEVCTSRGLHFHK